MYAIGHPGSDSFQIALAYFSGFFLKAQSQPCFKSCFKSCLWSSSDVARRRQNRKLDAEEEVTLKKSVAHDGRNCQVSVNFNLVMFGWKFISILINEPDEFVQ